MGVSDEIRQQQKKLKDMTLKGKISYIWDYYKYVIIVGLIVIIGIIFTARDIIDNNKPVRFYGVFINSNFAVDLSNTLEDDYVRCMGVDTDTEHVYFSYDINLMPDAFDTTSIAYQQKLVSLYTNGDLDIVTGPVDVMESAADCGGYSNLYDVLPAELIDELEEKGYELYTYHGRRYFEDEYEYMSEEDKAAIDNFEPYVAGIYLDNCSYLNNMGERGMYNLSQDEDKRPILAIPVTTKRLDKSIEFIRFITEE